MFHPVCLQNLISHVLSSMPFPDVPEATELILGTAAQESHLGRYWRQLHGGPARGIFQMEPPTASDHLRWIRQRGYAELFTQQTGMSFVSVNLYAQQYHILVQIWLARIHYYTRDPGKMPACGDLPEQAKRWKRYWNTSRGAGTEKQYIANWKRWVTPNLENAS